MNLSCDLELVHDFLAESPELARALGMSCRWAEPVLASWRGALPLPVSGGAFVEPPFFRPPGSHRCFYYCPASLVAEQAAIAATPRPVLAIKGSEVALPELDAVLRGFDRPCYSPHNVLEHLIFEEQKVPGALTLAEATGEARAARDIQLAHLRHYGGLARLPVPLLVLRHGTTQAARLMEQLRPLLSEAAFAAVAPWIREGLAVYVYHYPEPPVRVRDVEPMLQGLAFSQRTLALMTLCEPEAVVLDWTRTVARMLHLGVLPGSLASLHTGICCQPQNACLDGGFVDLGSLTSISTLKSTTAVDAALELSMDCLRDTVRALLMGSTDPTRSEGRAVRIDLHHLQRYLWSALRARLLAEARPGLELDPRVRRYFDATASFADLVDSLSSYYAAPSPSFARAAHAFGPFGRWLMPRPEPVS